MSDYQPLPYDQSIVRTELQLTRVQCSLYCTVQDEEKVTWMPHQKDIS